MILVRLFVAVLAGFAALLGLCLWALLGLVHLALGCAAAVFFFWALIGGALYLDTGDPAFLRGLFEALAMGAAPFALMLALMFATDEVKNARRRSLYRRREARPTDAPSRE